MEQQLLEKVVHPRDEVEDEEEEDEETQIYKRFRSKFLAATARATKVEEDVEDDEDEDDESYDESDDDEDWEIDELPNQVEEFLFIGSEDAAANIKQLREINIAKILMVGSELEECFPEVILSWFYEYQ